MDYPTEPLIPFIRRAIADCRDGINDFAKIVAEHSGRAFLARARSDGELLSYDWRVSNWESEKTGILRLFGGKPMLDERTADKLCTALGLHPIEVWGWGAYIGDQSIRLGLVELAS